MRARSPSTRRSGTAFASRLHFFRGDLTIPKNFADLKTRLESIEKERGLAGNRLFYLAIPPSAIGDVVNNLGQAGFVYRVDGGPWSRVIVEKPFGRDLESARALNEELAQVFRERQIFRIDHYLGKETTQNILVLRLGNGIFEPLWNRRYVDHVQITVAESIGVENRGKFYEEAGVLRDIIQNHVLQLLCLVAMEPPVAFDPNAVRDEKVKVLRSIQPQTAEEILRDSVRGQYGPGAVDGQAVVGYRSGEGRQPDVAPRDVRGLEGADRELALGGRAVLPPRRQAARRSASRRSRSSSRRRRSRSSGRSASSGRSRTSSSSGSSPTRASR